MEQSIKKVSINYLEQAALFFAPIKHNSIKAMEILPAQHVIDIGCGTGRDAIEMGKLVTSEGKVYGIDHDQNMIDEAEKNVKHQGMSQIISLHQGDVINLPFERDFLDSCRSERMFMHLNDPDPAFAEISRVTKPGGRIVIVDTDWPSLSIDTPLIKTERLLNNFRIKKVITNAFAGRGLYRLFKLHRLTDIEIDIFPLYTSNLELFYFLSAQEAVEQKALQDKEIDQQQLDQWRLSLQQASADGTFFSSINIVMVSGCKK